MNKTVTQESFLRVEEKFALSNAQFEQLMGIIWQHLVPDQYPRYTLHSLYFDTQEFHDISKSLDHPMFKEKIRMRSYGNPTLGGNVFLESKKKFKKVGQKRRYALAYQANLEQMVGQALPTHEQIAEELRYTFIRHHIQPKVFIRYQREAYSAKDDASFRITFDRHLRYRLNDLDLYARESDQPLAQFPDVLMEVKVLDAYPYWLAHALSTLRLYPTSFSKYGAIYKAACTRQASLENAAVLTSVQQNEKVQDIPSSVFPQFERTMTHVYIHPQ